MRILYKLIAGYLLVVALIWVVGLLAIQSSKAALQAALIHSSENEAHYILGRVNQDIESKINVFREYQQDVLLQQALLASNKAFAKIADREAFIDHQDQAWAATEKNDLSPFMHTIMDNDLSRELRAKIDFYQQKYGYQVYGEVFVSNRYGANIGQTGKTSDFRQNDEAWWKMAKKHGENIRDVAYDESAGVYSTDVAIRIDDEQGAFLGVMKIVLNIEGTLKLMRTLVNNNCDLGGANNCTLASHTGKAIFSTHNSDIFAKNIHLDFGSPAPMTSAMQHARVKQDEHVISIDVHPRMDDKHQGLGWSLRIERRKADVFASVTALKRQIIEVMLIISLLALLIAVMISKSIANPIRKLTEFADNMNPERMGESIDIRSSDEIGRLATGLNKMMRRLKDLTVSRDALQAEIHQRKAAEESLGKAFALLESLLDSVPDLIFYKDKESVYLGCNQAFCQFVGKASPDEIIGVTDFDMFDNKLAEIFRDRDKAMLASEKAQRNEEWVDYPDGRKVLLDTLKTPYFDKDGRIIGLIGISRDVTQFKDMEERFIQAQKMEAIGTLVGGIAHDFNNMLAGMTGNLYLAKIKVRENPELEQRLINIEELSLRAADMIQQLLTFARRDRVNIKALPFTTFIKEALKLLRSSVPENITFHQDICPDALTVKGDPTQLQQVLMNLVNNARDAVDDVKNPTISIRLEKFHADDTFIQGHANFSARFCAHLSIEDNGCGIPDTQLGHIFEPFFTTKEQGKGTGLGLAMVFGAVETHQGLIEVESRVGEGSVFHIYIPLHDSENTDFVAHEDMLPGKANGEFILLADDEKNVRDTSAEVLESMGYRVLLAKDGREAIEVFAAHQQDIAVALLDVIMPHLGGIELAGRIRELNPHVPIIFVTGYDKAQVLLDGSGQLENSEILSKPVNFDVLNQYIRNMIG
ncbi:MAG: ATP-binding protein [Mariprofundaceae bacterium]